MATYCSGRCIGGTTYALFTRVNSIRRCTRRYPRYLLYQLIFGLETPVETLAACGWIPMRHANCPLLPVDLVETLGACLLCFVCFAVDSTARTTVTSWTLPGRWFSSERNASAATRTLTSTAWALPRATWNARATRPRHAVAGTPSMLSRSVSYTAVFCTLCCTWYQGIILFMCYEGTNSHHPTV